MYGIYANIHHQYTPNVRIYHTWIDPMGFVDVLNMAFVLCV